MTVAPGMPERATPVEARRSEHARAPRRRRVREHGFTLLELVVVLFLLSLATALALPAVGRGIETLELRAQVAGFSAFLRYARAQAITKRMAHEVRVDGRELTLVPGGGEHPTARKQLSSRIRISADPPRPSGVTFWPQGFSSGASFRLEAQSGRAYRITVDSITGRVSNFAEAG